MKLSIQWTARALTRVEELLDFIARKDPAAARRRIGQLFDGLSALAQSPRLGKPHPRSSDPDLRRLVVRDYVVVYRVDEEASLVTVLTVRHRREQATTLNEVEDD